MTASRDRTFCHVPRKIYENNSDHLAASKRQFNLMGITKKLQCPGVISMQDVHQWWVRQHFLLNDTADIFESINSAISIKQTAFVAIVNK